MTRRRGLVWRLAAGLARRLRERLSPGEAPPPAPARTPPLRPERDPALLRRLSGWRRRAGYERRVDVRMTARESAAAMRDLEGLRVQMSPEQARVLDAHLGTGRVSVRRLRPEDGHMWEMPGMRVFAIVGVRAFTVLDDPPHGPGPGVTGDR